MISMSYTLTRFSWRNPNRRRRNESTLHTAHGHSMGDVSSCIQATMITVARTEETRDHLASLHLIYLSVPCSRERSRESGLSPPSAASRYPRPPRAPSCQRKQSSSSVAGMCRPWSRPWSRCRARTAAADAARSPRHRAWMLKGGGVGEL